MKNLDEGRSVLLSVALARVASTSGVYARCMYCISRCAVRERERGERFLDFNLHTYEQAPANVCIKQTSARPRKNDDESDGERGRGAMLRYARRIAVRIRRETRRVTRCAGEEFVIRTYARTYIYVCAYARPIFHPISVQDSDVVDGGKEGGRNTTDQGGSWKADRIRPLLLL